MFTRLSPVVALAIMGIAVPAGLQERFSFFQASTPESVERMLQFIVHALVDRVQDLGAVQGHPGHVPGGRHGEMLVVHAGLR